MADHVLMCACHCGVRVPTERAEHGGKYASVSCRKRAENKRLRARAKERLLKLRNEVVSVTTESEAKFGW